MFSMAGKFLRSKASSQSQDPHDHPTIPCTSASLADSKTSAYAQIKGMHQNASHSSTSNAAPTRERELSRKLLEKEDEIEEIQTYYEGKVSRREQEIQDLHNRFQAMLDKKGKELQGMRDYYTTILRAQERQQKNSKSHQRNADAEAEALREKLMTTEHQLELCRDDLFRLQPVCQISDGNIIAAFESLGEQIVNWIDNETSAFEKAYPDTPVGCLFSRSEGPDVACFLQLYPFSGEYLCRNLVNRYLLDHMFGTKTHRWGLSGDYTRMRLNIEEGMAALKPPRDSQTINIWRAETLSALGATQECIDRRERQSVQWTRGLFGDLWASFPNLFGREEVMERFQDQVTTPAMTVISQLQGLASPYRLGMVEKNMLNRVRVTKTDLNKVIAIDVGTGKTLKPGSVIVSDRDGVIGDFVLPLEPSLHRVNEGTSETELRRETWLVRLDHPLGSRAPKRN